MDFSAVANLTHRKPADLLAIPFFQKKKKAESAVDIEHLKSHVKIPLETEDFKAKEGEILIIYVDEKHEQRVALVGLGEQDQLTKEKLRRVYASLAKACQSRKLKSINLLLPKISAINEADLVGGIAEGLLLANYAFTKNKSLSIKDNPTVLLEKATLIGTGKHILSIANKYKTISEGVYLARDLVNGNADDITPQYLAKTAQSFAKKLPHVKTTVFDKKRIQKEKMGLLLAVSRGSMQDPVLIIVEYTGNPKSKDKTVVVGKGITYDTGGLNMKPTGSMETMKCDMGGAAAALGTIYVAAKLGLKINVTAVVPSTENSVSAASYKPGDVYNSYLGKTVEVGNTDAEGRLVLADALAYAVDHLKPTRMIDFATLTGAIDVALGAETAGIMSNNNTLADQLIQSGLNTYERAWRMPLHEEYKEQLKSDIADIKNIGGRSAGAITAAVFLQEFVGKTPWAHFDIAATAYLSEPRRYHPKYGTGVGVRLMIDFLEGL